jgi:hypothetical protein
VCCSAKCDFFFFFLSTYRCEEFRQQRILSIDRFAVEDPRTPEQIKEEEEITKRLKQTYKLAKINAAKKKEKGNLAAKRIDEEKDEDEASIEGRSPSKAGSDNNKTSARVEETSKNTVTPTSSPAKDYKAPKERNDTIKEGDNEDEDGEGNEEEDHFGSDDEEGEVDPEEAAIRAAFDDFSSVSMLEGFAADVIPVSTLQEAFIRIVNQFISSDLLEKAILDTDEIDETLEELTFPEFRLVFKRYFFFTFPI